MPGYLAVTLHIYRTANTNEPLTVLRKQVDKQNYPTSENTVMTTNSMSHGKTVLSMTTNSMSHGKTDCSQHDH